MNVFLFLHGDMLEEVYMDQSPFFVARWHSSGFICWLQNSLYYSSNPPKHGSADLVLWFNSLVWRREKSNHFVFFCHSIANCTYLVLYVDK